MSQDDEVEHVFGSTTFAWKRVKISGGAAGRTQQRRSRYGFKRLAQWPRSRPLNLRVTYRGGAESWWLVEARGTRQAFPGWMAIEDVMRYVHSER